MVVTLEQHGASANQLLEVTETDLMDLKPSSARAPVMTSTCFSVL